MRCMGRSDLRSRSGNCWRNRNRNRHLRGDLDENRTDCQESGRVFLFSVGMGLPRCCIGRRMDKKCRI